MTKQQLLSKLQTDLNSKSDEEVIIKALRLLDWLVEKRKDRYDIIVHKGNDVHPVNFILDGDSNAAL